jgi:hypothetical protein
MTRNTTANVGVERLGARDGQKYRAEGNKAKVAVGQQKADTMKRIDCSQNARIGRKVKEAADRERHEPNRRDRPKPAGDGGPSEWTLFRIPRGPLRPRQPAEDRQRWQDDVAPHEEQQ